MRLFVLIAVLLLMACQTAPPPAPTAVPAAAPAGVLQVGEEGHIALSVAEVYPLSQSPEVYRELDAATRGGDSKAVINALNMGRAVAVSNRTRVRVQAYDANLVQVVVLEGEAKDKSGWLPLNLVGH